MKNNDELKLMSKYVQMARVERWMVDHSGHFWFVGDQRGNEVESAHGRGWARAIKQQVARTSYFVFFDRCIRRIYRNLNRSMQAAEFLHDKI